MTVSLELSGPDASRPFIEAAAPEHPSLLDPTHQMDALFGVVNIPNVVWIDEAGVIVRPAEPGWPGPLAYPPSMIQRMIERAQQAAESGRPMPDLQKVLGGGQDRDGYPDAIRDWAQHGAESRYAMTPDEAIAASQPRTSAESEGAAHFELANHFWRAGRRDAAIAHFRACHRLQPDNWTYKRQAWSLIGSERDPSEMGRFLQSPRPGEEADWPFESSFDADVGELEPGVYYPKTL